MAHSPLACRRDRTRTSVALDICANPLRVEGEFLLRRVGAALRPNLREIGGMCGRVGRHRPAGAFAAEFGATPPTDADLRPRWNLCPGEDLLIVVQKGEERRVGTVRWGFLPWSARDANDGPRSINARSESVATRPAFRDAFRRHRCLVAADGFYEWRREGRTRRPFFVRLRSHRPMALAGLWDRWRPPEGVPLRTGLWVT